MEINKHFFEIYNSLLYKNNNNKTVKTYVDFLKIIILIPLMVFI